MIEQENSVHGVTISAHTETIPTHTIIIPAYNEEQGLGVVLEKVLKVVDEKYEIIVVDDGSTDRSAEIARGFPCQLISHGINQGKAAAMRTGIGAARGENLILIDADDTYPPEVIPDIAQSLSEYDMVITSRTEGRDNIPLFNRFGGRVLCCLLRLLYGFMPHDPLTGLYGIRKSVLLNMNLDSNGFGVETELAIKAGRMGLKTREVPIRYRPRLGESKLHGVRDGVRVLQIILKALALFSPTISFVLPGAGLLGIGLLLMSLTTLGTVQVGSIELASNMLMLGGMLTLLGLQAVFIGIGVDLYASVHRFAKPGSMTRVFLRRSVYGNLGRVGLLMILVGVGVEVLLGYDWIRGGFGDFSRTSQLGASSLLILVGLQIVLSSAFLSVFVSAMRDAPGAKVSTTPVFKEDTTSSQLPSGRNSTVDMAR